MHIPWEKTIIPTFPSPYSHNILFFLSSLFKEDPRSGCGKAKTMSDFLLSAYPWVKALHVISVVAWMAGLFYLPRLFVYHVERVGSGNETDALFQLMEVRLLRVIMNPAMIATWVFGLMLAFTPGVVDWGAGWPWLKAAGILGLTWFHHWLGRRRKEFVAGTVRQTGRRFRLMNEVPTLCLVAIVVAVIVRPF